MITEVRPQASPLKGSSIEIRVIAKDSDIAASLSDQLDLCLCTSRFALRGRRQTVAGRGFPTVS